jgi:TolB protein
MTSMRNQNFKVSKFSILSLLILAMAQSCSPVPDRPEPTKIETIQIPSPTLTLEPTAAPSATLPAVPSNVVPTLLPTVDEYYVLSLADNGYQHLFIYSPSAIPLYRITNGTWDDISPAISPDGKRVTFSSRRNGYFDIYILDLATGIVSRVTDSLAYDSSPSWSPDGQWIVYETYENGKMDIRISSASDPTQAPIQLTDDSFIDHSPAWSPQGRQVAFVSNRSGEDEIWVAQLDKADADRLINASNRPLSRENHPTWSGDGSRVAWSSTGGNSAAGIYEVDITQPGTLPNYMGQGDLPVWSPQKDVVASRLNTPNETYLTAYGRTGLLALPPVKLPGTLQGFSLGGLELPVSPPVSILQASIEPTPIWVPLLENSSSNLPPGRIGLEPLYGVQAPFPQLNDLTDESFVALRERLIRETGWDVLANLENAFTPLTSPSDPALGKDWIYTGRAFSLNPALLNAGWLLVVPEEFGEEDFWQVYLRPTAQDGSQGKPLTNLPWDLNARYNLDPVAYDQGGRLFDSVPTGYWVNLTELAGAYGWKRLPALNNWRTYFKGARFNELAFTSGLDWERAMLEVYPPEVLITPTAVKPPVFTPTRTPWGFKAPTATLTATPRPTFTPAP